MTAFSTLSHPFYLISQSSASYGIFPRSTPSCGRFVQSFSFPLNDINEFLQDSHIQALSKNNNLTDLILSSDFEVNARDTAKADNDYAWFVRCYKRRLKATQDITHYFGKSTLQRCSWVHSMGIGHDFFFGMSHSFVVEERMTGGNMTRVVRGIKQPWMGRVIIS
jgi:hypothetical protein